MKNIFILRFLLVFFYHFTVAYTSDGYFVHRDQFSLKDSDSEHKKNFYKSLQLSNEEKSQKIREYKSINQEELRNILLSSLYSFYDDEYKDIERKEITRVFLSGWLPTDAKTVQEFFKKEVFCLGSAYKEYKYFDNSTKILSIKRKPGSHFLSESIQDSTHFHPYENPKKSTRDEVKYEDTFIYKLIQDFSMRGIDFETPQGSIYNHQNHAHSEQAFFSCIQNSLVSEEIFAREDIPKAILVNIVSYLPTCSMEFCLTSIKTLLCDDHFKYKFLQKIINNLYKKHEKNWSDLIKEISINIIFTSSNLPPAQNVGFIEQNGILFKSLN